MAEARPYARLRKSLDMPLSVPSWPDRVRPVRLDAADPRAVHAILSAAFDVAPFDIWHESLVTDSEYDPALCIVVRAEDGVIAGFVQCWTSAFIKDLVVAPPFRGQGLGLALMNEAFTIFARRGASHVDLKVARDNHVARSLYARLGMAEIPE
ncbi:hypothetical protein VE26_09690 [Devosia chinhatensis]|uniref:N-acetyltransferase domain-containing protein n=1 Tax=Devosia chinhatensis TaxID=429727 RepID=A0A0F5FP98_9HYPH|nr:hypothetical protein VE26_09690 [Devosia chinhatensis]